MNHHLSIKRRWKEKRIVYTSINVVNERFGSQVNAQLGFSFSLSICTQTATRRNMATRNPKGAPIDPEFYEQPSTIACFEDIRQSLVEELQQNDIEARDLSFLTCQLQQFQQDHLGFNTKIANAPPRIPAKLFKLEPNVRETTDSPLYTILLAAYTHRANHQWRKWDFAPSKKTKNIDLIQSIRDMLVQAGWIQVPKVAFSNTVPEAARKSLMSMIKKMQCMCYISNRMIHRNLYRL